MLKGFWKLTWLEMKIFIREPMGVIGSLVVPVILYVIMGRAFGTGSPGARPTPVTPVLPFNIAVLAALFIALGAVTSLVAIISIYREGGILKRLRATPLTPITILGSHVIVKLVFTLVSLFLLVLAGRQLFPGARPVSLVSFTGAVLVSTAGILSLGFVIASLVPTARFAQPVAAAVLYPMVAISGLFVPLDRLPSAVRFIANLLPTTHAVSLMQGVWAGSRWGAHIGDVGALTLIAAACLALSTRIFRWE